MRSANQDQTAGSILLGEYLGISSARVLRKLSVVKSFPANPMIANCLESRLSAARLESAGMSLRLVRSPVAPKMTMTQGEATGFAFERFMRVPCNEFNAPRLRIDSWFRPSLPRDRRIENASRTKAWRRIRLHLGTRIARTGLRSIRKRARRTQCRREWSSGLRRNPTLGQKNARGKAAREARWRSGRAARRQRRCRGARLP